MDFQILSCSCIPEINLPDQGWGERERERGGGGERRGGDRGYVCVLTHG